MKKSLLFSFAFSSRVYATLVFCFLFLPASSPAQEVRKIKLSSFYYPPFYFIENKAIKGIAVDIVNELFGRLHIKVNLSMYPLKRALKYLEHAEEDGMMILIKTPEREEFLYFTDPITTVRGLIWCAADRKGGRVEFEKFIDLKPYKIGITRGYSYGEEFDQFLLSIPDIEAVDTDLQNYKKLMYHRIDIFPGNEIVAKGLFKLHPEFKAKFVHSEKAIIQWKLHMGISKKSQFVSIIPDINKVIYDLKKEGFIDKTISKYTE